VAPISDLLARGRTYSFEFFPPKSDEEHQRLARTLMDLQPLEPSFVSVTYRGGPSSRQRTHDLVVGMLRTTTLTPMAHLICAGHTRLELAEILVQLRQGGVDNLMALGGDTPTDPDAPEGELRYAHELVELARAIGGFSIGVAAHPAGHPRSASLPADRDRLAEKLRLADFAVTQSVFDVGDYLRLVDDLAARGVTAPVVPGVMPLTTLSSIGRPRAFGGGGGPVSRGAAPRGPAHAAAVRSAGIEFATELCGGLLDAGAPGLHFYTLNYSLATREIYANLGLRKVA
jgi:methylenetetrahydrofolate reductase (NADPH)